MKPNDINQTSDMTDEAIIELYWQRNEQAIAATDQKYGRYLYTIAYNIINDRLDCEECLNDTYLNTWNAIPPKRPSAFAVFLSKIIRNLALERFRYHHAVKRVPSEMVVSMEELDDCLVCTKSVEEEYLLQEMVRILNDYLLTLTDRQMYVFVWRYYHCDTLDNIAQMIGMSKITVRRELATIRAGLKARLEKEGYTYEA